MKFILSMFFLASLSFAKDKLKTHASVFPNISSVESIKIDDDIDKDKSVNKEILIAFDKKKNLLGFIREIKTSTGCNSGCLPVIFNLYYSPKKVFIDLTSGPGLTKKNHARFTKNDYLKLKEIILRNPEKFKPITHPYELVDMVTGATKKSFENDVVSKAAYTSFRVNLYNQQTLKLLEDLP